MLLSNKKAAEMLGVHPRTLSRWDARPELQFPPAVKVGQLLLRSKAALLDWEKRMFFRKEELGAE